MTPFATANIDGQPTKLFGYVPPAMRTADQQSRHEAVMAGLPAFSISGSYRVDNRKVALYEARQKISGKTQPEYIQQVTGSCVGCGGCNAVLTLRDVEIAIKGEREIPEMVWWPYTYGESRQIAGMSGRGEGSFGSAYAKAITQKGIFSAAEAGLPQYENDRGWLKLSQSIELEWSDGQQSPAKWDAKAKEHLVQTASPCKSAEDVAAAIQNGYPCTIACMFGTKGPKIQGTPAVHVAEWDDQWAHQQMIDAWWDHPQLGELFRIGNSWNDAHGEAPDGSPRGGYYIRKATLARICSARDAEIFALSAFNGFPARTLPDYMHF